MHPHSQFHSTPLPPLAKVRRNCPMPTKTDFKVIPGQSELDRIERDLSFHPALYDAPATLSRDQIAHFNCEGYIRGIRIFTSAEIADIRSDFDRLLANVLAVGGASSCLSTGHF